MGFFLRRGWPISGGSFTLTDISGLVVWYDTDPISGLNQNADCSSTPVASDGDPVGCAADKSGNGYNVTQSTTSAKPTYDTDTNPINSSPVFDFNGHYLVNTTGATDLHGNFTMFCVVQTVSSTGSVIWGWGDDAVGERRLTYMTSSGYVIFAGHTNNVLTTYAINDGNPHYIVITNDGTTVRVRADGAERGNGTPTLNAFTSNQLALHHFESLAKLVGQGLTYGAYDSGLTGDDLTNLESYLANRAGL